MPQGWRDLVIFVPLNEPGATGIAPKVATFRISVIAPPSDVKHNHAIERGGLQSSGALWQCPPVAKRSGA